MNDVDIFEPCTDVEAKNRKAWYLEHSRVIPYRIQTLTDIKSYFAVNGYDNVDIWVTEGLYTLYVKIGWRGSRASKRLLEVIEGLKQQLPIMINVEFWSYYENS